MCRGYWLGLMAVVVAAGCGGDDDDTGAAADAAVAIDAADTPDAPPAGPGLTIQGAFTARNVANIEVDANTRVDVSMRIERDGTPVTNAVVRINPPMSFQTVLTGEPLDPSLYTGNYMGYHNDTVRIEISSDDDDIPEKVIPGQPLFKITAPLPSTTVNPGEDLVVTWNRPGATATSLRVRTEGGHDSGELADTDTYTIPGADITTGTADDAVLVTRCRRTDALGGDSAAGTFVDFCVESRLGFSVLTE